MGFFPAGHTDPNCYTQEHLRRAELLAIPAAAAIQNARLYQTAQIYGSELEKRIVDLKQAEAALAEAEGSRRLSEDKFQKVFRSSPIPFSTTTIKEGRFVDVNAAFERRYGYSRAEVHGRTVLELKIWEDPMDRVHMTTQLQQGPIRNVITRVRTKSGETRLTAYSADRIQFEGESLRSCSLRRSAGVQPTEAELRVRAGRLTGRGRCRPYLSMLGTSCFDL